MNSTLTSINNICLGTTKLGIPDYGFSSSDEKSGFNSQEFLKQVGDLEINKFDTSPRYGDSEKILGEYVKQSNHIPFISSKIDNLKANNPNTFKEMLESVNNSIDNLNKEYLDICYLHQNKMEIISDPYIQEGLEKLKDLRLIKNTGASIYSIEECQYVIEINSYDYIQVPVNIVDMNFYDRFIKNQQTTVRFVARSLLLQGIIVNRDKIAERIHQSSDIFKYLNKFDDIAKNCGMTALQLGLVFVFSLSGIDHYIIGTTSIENLKNNTHCLDFELPKSVYESIVKILPSKKWVNPKNWN